MQSIFRLLRILIAGKGAWRISIPACLILAGLAEGIGIATLSPLIVIGMNGEGTETGVSRVFFSALDRVGLPPDFSVLLAVMVTAILVKSVLLLLGMKHVGSAIARYATDLRLSLIRAQLRSAWSHLTRQSVGKMAHAIGPEPTRASTAYLYSAHLLADVAQTVVYLLLALLVSWRLSALAVVIGGISIGVLHWLVAWAKRAATQETDLTASLTARLVETMGGIKPLKATARADLVRSRLEDNALNLERASSRVLFTKEAVPILHEPVLVIFIIATMIIVAALLHEPLPDIILVGAILYRVAGKLTRVQRSYLVANTLEHVLNDLRQELAEATAAAEETGGSIAPIFRRKLELREVGFAYAGTPVLNGVSLVIPAGEMTVIFGPSGAGKTTLIDVITGLHRPQFGAVLVDGVPLGEIDLDRWRRTIGYVSQDSPLFDDTIFNNVTLGDAAISADQVHAALETAQAWDFVDALPQGLLSVVGERGSTLSAGQRQRVALARALVFAPNLLILDEATAALDSETEKAAIAALRSVPKLTLLVVSHQPALAAVADNVYDLARPSRPVRKASAHPLPSDLIAACSTA